MNYHRSRVSCSLISSRTSEEKPGLTIVIPTYGRSTTFKETVRSVEQVDFPVPIELLVVDNSDFCAKDKDKVLSESKLPFRYFVNEENIGMFPNWNRGVELSSTNMITILHDDDLLLPGFQRVVERSFDDSMHGHLISGWVEILDQREGIEEAHSQLKKFLGRFFNRNKIKTIDITKAKIFEENRYSGTLGVVFERSKFLDIGGFESAFYPASDYCFWMKYIIKFGQGERVSSYAGKYRLSVNESLNSKTIESFSHMNKKIQLSVKEAMGSEFFADLVIANQFKIKEYNNWVGFTGKTKDGNSPSLVLALYIKLLKLMSRFITRFFL